MSLLLLKSSFSTLSIGRLCNAHLKQDQLLKTSTSFFSFPNKNQSYLSTSTSSKTTTTTSSNIQENKEKKEEKKEEKQKLKEKINKDSISNSEKSTNPKTIQDVKINRQKPTYQNTSPKFKEKTKLELEKNIKQESPTEIPITDLLNSKQPIESIANKSHPYFSKLGLIGPLVQAINDLGYIKPTPIQDKVIVKALKGHNIVASSQTGTGKTAAFLLPALQRLYIQKKKEMYLSTLKNSTKEENSENIPIEKRKGPLLLCLLPTKELAEQLTKNAVFFAKYLNADIKTVNLFGGVSDEKQIKQIESGVDVMIATPGRLVKLIKEYPDLNLESVQTIILDECDRMLDLGFFPDVLSIYKMCNIKLARKGKVSSSEPSKTLQTLLFSATLMPSIEGFLNGIARKYILINLNSEKLVSDTVSHNLFHVHNRRKQALLVYLLQRKNANDFHLSDAQVLIFTRTKIRADNLAKVLKEKGFSVASVHNDLSITKRTEIIDSFKNGKIKLLITTDMMARGIDIPELPFVVNYDVPVTPEDYIHRVGRTGRIGYFGTAITFVSKEPVIIKTGGRIVELNEQHFIKNIESTINKKLNSMSIPGNFRDEDIVEPTRYSETIVDEAERLKRIFEKKHEEKKERELQLKIQRNKYRNQNINVTGTDNREEKRREGKETTLRDFKEGRYEDVMKSWDNKRAIKRGIQIRNIKPKERRLK